MLARLERLLFVAGILVFVFVGGMAARHFETSAYTVLDAGLDAGRDWRSSWKVYLGLEPTKHLREARQDGAGLIRHVQDKAYPGVTFMTGLIDREVALSLRAMDGTELHRWHAPFTGLFPNPPHLRPEQVPVNDWDAHLHGAVLHPNGDVVFNFENLGLVKLDRCGSVLWRLSHRTHHSVFEDAKGHLWVPARRPRASSLPGVASDVEDEMVLEISADGKVIREISVLNVIFSSHYEGVIFANAQYSPKVEGDALHLNQV
jgi:hypothetical protein